MPATCTETTTFTCSNCHRERPLSQACLTGTDTRVCFDCFDRHYTRCAGCGELVLREAVDSTSNYYAPRTIDGDVYCWACSCYRQTDYGTEETVCWRPIPMASPIASYDEIGSTRKYGVEIETSECPRYERLRGNTHFGAKPDCTVDGLEFDSPVLYGDEGLAEIRKFLEFADEHDWAVDDNCGCHTHYDMRGESDESLARIAYAYRICVTMLEALVDPSRVNGEYCGMPRYSLREIRQAFSTPAYIGCDFRYWCEGTPRYTYVNLYAIDTHNTFEIRILEGSIDAELICNWIKFNARFMDWAKTQTFDDLDTLFSGKSPAEMVDIAGNAAGMNAWLRQRFTHCQNM